MMTRRELINKLSDCLEEDMDKPVWITTEGLNWTYATSIISIDKGGERDCIGDTILIGKYDSIC